jgi:plastocyanin
MRLFTLFITFFLCHVLSAQDVTVTVTNFSFTPQDVTITQGETITWENIDGNHNVNGSQATFPDNPEGFFSGSAGEDWTFSHTFTIPGFYDYRCDPHASFMFGTVTVEPAGNTIDLILTGVIDGPLSGGTPKAVEMTAVNDIADLSAYGVGSANNGGGSDGVEFSFPPVSVSAGDCIYLATDSMGFFDFFGFYPDYVAEFATAVNGDDAVELFKDSVAVDVFGDINVDGSGQPWDYLDGWVYRVSGTGPDGNTFVPSNWIYSGINALDNETSNNTAANPFPGCSYMPDLPVQVIANDDVASTNQNQDVVIDVLANDNQPNAITSLTVLEQPDNGTATVNGLTEILYSPEMDFCGETDVFSYEVCDDIGCDTAEVSVFVICPSVYPQYSIQLVSNDGDGDFVPDSLGISCEVQGIVHGIDLRGVNGIQFTIIDESDVEAGIGVFNGGDDFGYEVEEGDIVLVRGVVDQFNGLTQIVADTILEIGSAAIYSPQVVLELDETTESKLVRINNLSLVNPGDWDQSGSSFNVEATDGFNNFQIRIDSDVNIAGQPAPQEPFDLIGIGGQFDTNAPFDGGYQVLPRYMEDIIETVNTTQLDLSGAITFGPNPVSSSLSIQADMKIDRFEVHNMFGQVILSDQPNTLSWAIPVASWAPGLYSLTFFTEEGSWTTMIVKQ